MKSVFRIALFLMTVLASAACSQNGAEMQAEYLDVTPNNISGTWSLSEWRGEPLQEGLFVYLELTRRDKQFTMHENISGTSTVTVVTTGRYDLYDGDVINGIYDNSLYEYWAHSYAITELTSDRMVWTATDSAEDVMVYVRIDAIPSGI